MRGQLLGKLIVLNSGGLILAAVTNEQNGIAVLRHINIQILRVFAGLVTIQNDMGHAFLLGQTCHIIPARFFHCYLAGHNKSFVLFGPFIQVRAGGAKFIQN